MDQMINYKHKIDYLLSNDTSSSQPTQTAVKQKLKVCIECNKRKRTFLDESHQICLNCFKAKSVYIPSGNKVIDDFIRSTLIGNSKLKGKMVFVPFEQFKNIEFIAEGGFSKIYKATWISGPPISNWNKKKQSFFKPTYNKNYQVVLKKLNSSKVITSKELYEVIIIIN
jgi:hypothetical protein